MSDITLGTCDDTYCENANPSYINGSKYEIPVCNNNGNWCGAFFKFDLTGIDRCLTATLELNIVKYKLPYGANTNFAFQCLETDAAWTEEDLCYNTMGATADSTQTNKAYSTIQLVWANNLEWVIQRPISFDVTAIVRAALARKATKVSFLVVYSSQLYVNWYNSYFYFSTKEENVYTEHRPKLILGGASGSAILPVHYFRESSVSVRSVYTRGDAICAPDIGVQPLPDGWVREVIYADTTVDENSSNSLAEYYNDYKVTIESRNGTSMIGMFKCSIDDITDCRQAKLRLLLTDVSVYGTHETLRLRLAYANWSAYSHWATGWQLTVPMYVDIPTSSLGLIEIDITPLVQTALGMGFYSLAFSMAFADHRADTDILISFTSAEAPIKFKPEVIIDTRIPEPDKKYVLSDGDACIDSSHPKPTVLPFFWNGADWYEYPIRYSGPYQGAYIHFDLTDLQGTIKKATLNFSVLSRSTFLSLEQFVFNIQTVSAPFNKDTVGYATVCRPGYCSRCGTAHNPCGKSTLASVESFEYSDSGDAHSLVSVDVTAILKYALYDTGILFLVSSANSSAPSAVVMISGRWGVAPPYLEIEVEKLPVIHPAETINNDIDDGYAVFHSVSDYSNPEEVHWNDYTRSSCSFRWKSNNLPEHKIGADHLMSDGSNVRYRFDLSALPDDMVFGYLENATIMIPFLESSISPSDTSHTTIYTPLVDIYVNKPDGTFSRFGNLGDLDDMTYVKDKDDEVVMRIPKHKAYISINVKNTLRRSDFIKDLREYGNIFEIWLYKWDRRWDSQWVRFGSTAGNYPAILMLRWDKYGHACYVNGESGDDTNDGLSEYAPWRHWAYAMNHIGNSGALYYYGRQLGSPEQAWPRLFDCEPEGNRIAPLRENVTVRPYGASKVTVEVNDGYNKVLKPYAEEQQVDDDVVNFAPLEGYLTAHFCRPSSWTTAHAEARFFFRLGDLERPVKKAVLRVYVASLYNPQNSMGGDHAHLYATRLVGGGMPGTTTGERFYTDFSLGDYNRWIVRDYASFDVTAGLNYIDPDNDTDIVGFGLRVSGTPAGTFYIRTPSLDCDVVPDKDRTPVLYIAETDEDITRLTDVVLV